MTATLLPSEILVDPSPDGLDAPCGTERGYRRHLDAGESTACGHGCREAHGRAVKGRLASPVMVPPRRARAHVQALVAAGMPMTQIQAVADVSHDTIEQLLAGGQRRILRSTEARLLAVELVLAGRALVPQVGTLRRVQALLRIGWSHDAILAETGVSTKMLTRKKVTGMVTAGAAERVRVVFDALCMRPGPSLVTAARAARLGYAPPLAWDEDTIDDPAARAKTGTRRVVGDVDELTVDLLVDGLIPAEKAHNAERREAVRILAARGLDDGEIAVRLGTTREAVNRMRARHGIAAATPRPGTLGVAS